MIVVLRGSASWVRYRYTAWESTFSHFACRATVRSEVGIDSGECVPGAAYGGRVEELASGSMESLWCGQVSRPV